MNKLITYLVILIGFSSFISCSNDDDPKISLVGTWKVHRTVLDGAVVISQVSKIEFTENNKVTFFYIDFPTIEAPESKIADWIKNGDVLTIYWTETDSNSESTTYEIIELTESTLYWKIENTNNSELNQTLIK